MAQEVVYQGQTTQLSVAQEPGETYVWELYNDGTVDFAKVTGACPTNLADFVGGNTGAAVRVEWKEPGTYFFKVTALNITGCTNNLKVGIVKVLPSLPKAVLSLNPDEICNDGSLSELKITFSGGKGPWNMKLQVQDLLSGTTEIKDYLIDATDNPYSFSVGPKASTEYRIVELSNFYGNQPDLTDPSNSITLTVHPLPQKTPIFLKMP